MIFENLRKALANQFEIEPEKITRDTDIFADLGADSLDLVELLMSFEDEFGAAITDESVYQFKTVGEIADFMESQIKNT